MLPRIAGARRRQPRAHHALAARAPPRRRTRALQAAFQEFLKRIPSATNLANGSCEPPPPLPTALLAPPASGAPESSAALPGMPRVPSLDVLRQLVIQGQLQGQGFSQPSLPSAKAEPAAPPGERTHV